MVEKKIALLPLPINIYGCILFFIVLARNFIIFEIRKLGYSQ